MGDRRLGRSRGWVWERLKTGQTQDEVGIAPGDGDGVALDIIDASLADEVAHVQHFAIDQRGRFLDSEDDALQPEVGRTDGFRGWFGFSDGCGWRQFGSDLKFEWDGWNGCSDGR